MYAMLLQRLHKVLRRRKAPQMRYRISNTHFTEVSETGSTWIQCLITPGHMHMTKLCHALQSCPTQIYYAGMTVQLGSPLGNGERPRSCQVLKSCPTAAKCHVWTNAEPGFASGGGEEPSLCQLLGFLGEILIYNSSRCSGRYRNRSQATA